MFDGLPVRQWRQQETTVQPPVAEVQNAFGLAQTVPQDAAPGRPFDKWAVERAMPRGSELYAPWCQQILRAARAGKIAKKRDPSEIARERQEKENEGEENATKDGGPRVFTARRWQQLPRHAEEPEREFLAKRRKGLTSAYALTTEGAVVNIAPLDQAPTVEERRRNIPPRRKPKKGFQKKKKMSDGAGLGVSASAEALAAKKEAAARAAEGDGGGDGDTPMPEACDDEDGEEGEEDDEDGEGEGEGDGDGEGEGEGEGDQDDEAQSPDAPADEGEDMPKSFAPANTEPDKKEEIQDTAPASSAADIAPAVVSPVGGDGGESSGLQQVKEEATDAAPVTDKPEAEAPIVKTDNADVRFEDGEVDLNSTIEQQVEEKVEPAASVAAPSLAKEPAKPVDSAEAEDDAAPATSVGAS